MQEKSFTFLAVPGGVGITGASASVINAHIARHRHQKQRRRQQRESSTHPSPALSRVSSCVQCGLHHTLGEPLCFWCQQIKQSNTSLSLYCGNSDPFSALPLPVDAKVNRYLSIGRNLMGPLVRGTGPPDLIMKPGQAQLKIFADSEPSSSQGLPLYKPDETAGGSGIIGGPLFGGQLTLDRFESTPPEWTVAHLYSILAYCANALATTTGAPEHLTEALRYSATCMKELRKCVDLSKLYPELRVEELVYRLLRAEIVGKNYSSASIHAKYLQQLIQKKAGVDPLDPEALSMVIHTDNYLALCRISWPSFEPSWLRMAFAPSWNQLDMLFSHYIHYDIEYCAPSVEMQEILVAENKLFRQSSILQARGDLASQANWHWMVSQRECLQNRILHRYADQVHGDRYALPKGAQVSSVDDLFEQCLLLAALIAVRVPGKIPTVGGAPLSSATVTLGRLMDSTFAELELAADENWFRANAQPLIWMTFVAALTEHKLHSHYRIMPPTVTIWLMRLRLFTREANLRSWPELLLILTKFPYTPLALPLPYQDWPDKVFGYA